MAVTFNAAGALAVNATTVTLPVVAPTLSAGDLMICCLINKSVTANTISPPDGTWTTVIAQEINDCTTAADDHAYVIFAKFASAGDSGATFNFTKATDDNLLFAGVISAWTGVAQFDATAANRTLNATAADAVTFPAYDPAVACHVVFVAFYGNDLTTFAAAMSSDTNPDCTTRFDLETATGNDATIACTSGDNTDGANIASRTWASVSTTDAGSTGVVFGLVAGSRVAVAADALNISGSGRVDLIDLLTPRLHLTDGPVVAELTGLNLSASITSEAVTVIDAATLSLDPLQANTSESLRVADTITATETPLQANPSETLRISESSALTLNPLQATLTEALIVSDGPLSASLGGLVLSVGSESLRIVDAVQTTLDPLETVRVEALSVVDGPVAASTDQQASLTDTIRISESVAVTLSPLQASPSESVIVSDSAAAAIGNDLSASLTELIRLIELNHGLVQLYGVIHITDGPVVASLSVDDLSASLVAEDIKVLDTVAVSLDPLRGTPSGESLAVTDTSLVSVDPLQASTIDALCVVDGPMSASLGELVVVVPAESCLINDSVSASLDLTVALTESICLSDLNQGLVQLYGVLHITDGPVVASLSVDYVGASLIEGLRVTDTLALFIDLEVALTESVRLSDLNQGLVQLYGVLHISDGPAIAVLTEPSLLTATLSETIRLRWDVESAAERGEIEEVKTADTAPIAQLITVSLPVEITADTLKISDTVTASLDLLLAVVDSESLRLAESVSASLDTLQQTVAESLKIAESLAASLDPLAVELTSEAMRVVDGPLIVSLGHLTAVSTEAIRIAESLDAVLNPLDAVLIHDVLLLVDQYSVTVDPLQATPVESFTISDTQPPFAVLTQPGDLTVVLTESVRLIEGNQGLVQLYGVLHITDGPVIAQLDNNPSIALTESLRVTDSVTAHREPLEAVLSESLRLGLDLASAVELVTLEALKIGDTAPSAALVVSGAVNATETLRLSEVVAVTLNPLETSVSQESLRVSDSPATLIGLAVAPIEALRVADTVSASLISMGQLEASASESVVVVDTVVAQTNLLRGSASESLSVQDQLTASLGLLGTSHVEAIRCQDIVTAALDVVVVATESVRVADSVTARIDPLYVDVGESARLFDSVQASLSHLQADVSESLRVQDTLALGVDLLAISLTEAVYCQDVASVSFILARPREFFIVAAQDRWFVVAAQDRWFIVDGDA